jgi:hypothetical protein
MVRIAYLPLLALGTLGACGLISPDVTDFQLRFPQHNFQIDTNDWQLGVAGTIPSIPCVPPGTECSSLCATTAQGRCTAECSSGGFCEGQVTISLTNDYNLATEAPEYAEIASRPVVSVTVDDLWFQITQNTLNVPTPALGLYVGPVSITSASDPLAKLVGTIPPIPSRFTGRVTVDFGANGKATLKQYMDDFHTPFRMIVTGAVSIEPGPAPMGQLTGYVQATAHAGL